MSAITDIIRQYSEGQVDWPTVRDTLRQVTPKEPVFSGNPWTDDWGTRDEAEGTIKELTHACVGYDLTPDEYRQAIKSLLGQSFGPRNPEQPEEPTDEPAPDPDAPGLAIEPEPAEPVEKGTVSIVKRDERRNLVFGWANVAFTPDGQQVEDHQGHLIDLEDLESAAYDYVVKYRLTGDMHQGDGFGELVESMVVTEDKVEKAGFPRSMLGHWWVGFRVPPEHWDAVQKGDRVMFSIQGKARLEPFEEEPVAKHAVHRQKDHGNRGMGPSEVADKAVRLGVHKIYASSIRDMADWASTKSGRPHGDRVTGRFVDVQMARGSKAKDWPLTGAIILTRDDGQKFRLYLTGKNYKVDPIAKPVAKHAMHNQKDHGNRGGRLIDALRQSRKRINPGEYEYTGPSGATYRVDAYTGRTKADNGWHFDLGGMSPDFAATLKEAEEKILRHDLKGRNTREDS